MGFYIQHFYKHMKKNETYLCDVHVGSHLFLEEYSQSTDTMLQRRETIRVGVMKINWWISILIMLMAKISWCCISNQLFKNTIPVSNGGIFWLGVESIL